MAGTNRFLMVWPLLLATVLPYIYSNFYPLLNQYADRVPLVNPGSNYAEHGPKNNGKCKSFAGAVVPVVRPQRGLTRRRGEVV